MISHQPGEVKSFSQNLYSGSVRENTPVGTPIGAVQLEGGGADSQDEVEVYVSDCRSSARGRHRGLFDVDRTSGQVRTASIVDREQEGSEVIIDIVAISTLDGSMATTQMKVDIIDENDSAPYFDPDFRIRLSEAYNPGHQVARVQARDSDLNRSGH